MASKLVLDGGIALVTGAASGIGKETAFAFAEAGAEGVVVADINKEGAELTASEIAKFATNPNFRSVCVQANVTNEGEVQNMIDTAIKEFGRIDYFVHSAGMGNISGATTENVKPDVFDRTVELNIRGTMLVVRAVSRAMATQEPRTHRSPRHGTERSLGRGSIVTLASVNGHVPAPGMMPYVASKHAVIGITKTAALDNIKNQIRVNAVCPAWTDTPMMKASLERYPPLGQIIKTMSPLGRAASAEEVADSILYLCSPSASYINGTSLVVDAGLTIMARGAAGI